MTDQLDFDSAATALAAGLAEESLLAVMLTNAGAAWEAHSLGLRASMFSRPDHAQAFEHIMRCTKQVGGPDISLIAGTMTAAGLSTGILERLPLVRAVASRSHQYAEQVRDSYLARRLSALGASLHLRGESGHRGSTLLSEAREELWQLERGHQEKQAKPSFAEGSRAAKERALRGDDGTTVGVSTPWASVNTVLQTTKFGRLVVLAARTATGKTSVALQWGLWLAMTQRVPVGFVSIEMNADEFYNRAHAQLGRIPLVELEITGRLQPKHESALEQASASLDGVPFFLEEMDDDQPSVANIESVIAWWVLRHGVKVVFVDNVQIMAASNPHAANRHQQLSEVARQLKNLAKRYQIIVVLLSQITRESTRTAEKRPTVADLKESGGLEDNADQVIILHRPEMFKAEDQTIRGLMEVFIGKNRNGSTGTVQCTWISQQVRLLDGKPMTEAF